MGKVVMLSDEVYEQLSRMKGPKESFSDVIKRLLKYRLSLLRLLEARRSRLKIGRGWVK